MYKITVYKNFGPFEFFANSYEEAVACLKDKWFSPGVWDVRMYRDDEEVAIDDLVRSWGDRPVYC